VQRIEDGDAEQPNARSTGRARPKKDYNGMNRGTSNDFSKGSFPTAQPKPNPPIAKT